MKTKSKTLVLAVLLSLFLAPLIMAQDDTADIPSKRLSVENNLKMNYFQIGPLSTQVPDSGYGLVVIMPGGDGGPDFHPFVKRIYKYALKGDYLAVQPIAVPWSAQQQIVWPTKNDHLDYAKFTTEQFVNEIIKSVQKEYTINPNKIFTLSWSSSGPAAYAVSLDSDSPVVGSYIAMSIFKPAKLGSLQQANGHAYFLDHSPDDKVCPFWMAQKAETELKKNGAAVHLNTYSGGHGWHGNVFERISKGIAWLETPSQIISESKPASDPNSPVLTNNNGIILQDDFEDPRKWQRGAKVPGVKYHWDRKQAYQGKASLCLSKNVNKYFPIAEWSRIVPCSDTKTVHVSVWVKARKAGKATIDLQFLDKSGNWKEHKWAAYIGAEGASDPPANHNWQLYESDIEVPPGTDKIAVAFQIYGPGTVWIDDLTIRKK